MRRSRSHSVSESSLDKAEVPTRRSGSVQDLRINGKKDTLLRKKPNKLTRQESLEIKRNDENYLKSHPELTEALKRLFVHLCKECEDKNVNQDALLESAVDFFANSEQ